MSMDDTVDRLGDTASESNKWVGVYIGILAVVLAICNVGGANATKDATRANIEAANTWAFYQAKNIRRSAVNMAADELELLLLAQPSMPAEARKAFEAKIKDYRATVGRITSEPETGEGLEQLLAKGKALEIERDIALRRDPYFDWSQALLQIAIVLASVHIIIGNPMLLTLSRSLGRAWRAADAQRLHPGPCGCRFSADRQIPVRWCGASLPAAACLRHLARRASYFAPDISTSPGLTMTTYSLLLLPGDGIGVEVMAEVERVVSFFNKKGKAEFKTRTGLVGGAAIDKLGVPARPARRWLRRRPPTPSCSVRSAGRSGTRCPTRTVPRPACCGCARTSTCSPTCAPPSAIRRWPRPRRCGARWSRVSTSSSCAS